MRQALATQKIKTSFHQGNRKFD